MQLHARVLGLLVLVGSLAACDVGASAPPPPARLSEPAADFEHLRAVGYTDWDEGADRKLTGVVRFDRQRTWPGYSVYTNDANEAYLCDLAGRRVHTWRLPGTWQIETFELLPGGGIIALSVGKCLMRLDWDSRVVWRRDLAAHHDVTRAPDDRFLVLFWGRGRSYRGRAVRFDGIAWFSPEGELVDRWSSWRHLAELRQHHRPSPLDVRPEVGGPPAAGSYEYYHINSVEVLPDTPLGRRDARFAAGNLLICLRNVDTIAILERRTRNVLWAWGGDELQMPHMPTMLPNGHVLVFDNGRRRGYSRVLEVEPASGEIVWSHEGDPPQSFYSPWRGSNQRLPNGNTLICESERGHAFEIDADGDVVWEFWNPELLEGKRKRIYRLLRLDAGRVERILEAHR